MVCFFFSSVSLGYQIVLPKLRGEKKPKHLYWDSPPSVVFTLFKTCLCSFLKIQISGLLLLGVFSPHIKIPVL